MFVFIYFYFSLLVCSTWVCVSECVVCTMHVCISSGVPAHVPAHMWELEEIFESWFLLPPGVPGI